MDAPTDEVRDLVPLPGGGVALYRVDPRTLHALVMLIVPNESVAAWVKQISPKVEFETCLDDRGNELLYGFDEDQVKLPSRPEARK